MKLFDTTLAFNDHENFEIKSRQRPQLKNLFLKVKL